MLRVIFVALMISGTAQAADTTLPVAYIQSELRFQYGLKVDVMQLTNRQISAIYLQITSSDDGEIHRTRQRVKTIIRRGKDF